MAFSRRKYLLILILGLLSAIGPLSIDMYLPGFETITRDLSTTIEKVQLSLTSFFVGIALGQLLYGPLLDRFGRKKPLIVGLMIYIGSSVACAFAHSAEALITFRFLQAMGSCAGMVAARAMVRDYFQPGETAKVFSLLMLVIGVSPIVAPTLGSYIIHYIEWHYIFWLLALIAALILAAVVFFIPKGAGGDPLRSLKPRPILKNFGTVLRLPQFLVYALAGGFASSGLYAYLSASPFVMMELYGLNERQYGWVFGILAASLITSSQVNNVVLRKYKSEQVSRIALLIQASCGILMILLYSTGWMNLYWLIGLIFCYLGCQGFVFPNTSALALNPFSRSAGSASALMGSIQLSIGAIASVTVSVLHNGTSLPMVSVMAACSLISCLVLLFAPKEIASGEL